MSKFRAENGRLQTHQPRKWNSHYRAEPEQRILCLFLLIFNFALAGAQTDQSQNLPWKNETRGLSKSVITQFLRFLNTCYHYLSIIHIYFNPISILSQPQVESSHSTEDEGGHAHQLTVAWVDNNTGQDVLVDLNLNRDLIPESYMERYHHEVRLPGLGYLNDIFRPLVRHLTNQKGRQDVKVQKRRKLSNEDGCPSWSVEAMCEIYANNWKQTK